MDESRDHLEMRCPRLGGVVSFGYCRSVGEHGLPCAKIADCWWERFDVVAFLKTHLSPHQFERLVEKQAQPQPKVASLIDLIEQARKRTS